MDRDVPRWSDDVRQADSAGTGSGSRPLRGQIAEGELRDEVRFYLTSAVLDLTGMA